VLRRNFSAEEVLRVAKLDPNIQQSNLRELLAGRFLGEEAQFRTSIFYYESRFLPSLRALAREPGVTEQARELLCMIGVPDDLRLIMRLPPPPASDGFPERWRYAVAAALVQPDTEAEWIFLRRCALNEFDDHRVDAGAIRALQLSA
jgi:hypothetical protein